MRTILSKCENLVQGYSNIPSEYNIIMLGLRSRLDEDA